MATLFNTSRVAAMQFVVQQKKKLIVSQKLPRAQKKKLTRFSRMMAINKVFITFRKLPSIKRLSLSIYLFDGES